MAGLPPPAAAGAAAPAAGAATTTDIESLHLMACLAGKDGYKDPASGYTCFTESFHRKRGQCCGSACRHCPYGYARVVTAAAKRSLAEGRVAILSGVLEGFGEETRVVAARGGGGGGGGGAATAAGDNEEEGEAGAGGKVR
jgi:hypothetical protein